MRMSKNEIFSKSRPERKLKKNNERSEEKLFLTNDDEHERFEYIFDLANRLQMIRRRMKISFEGNWKLIYLFGYGTDSEPFIAMETIIYYCINFVIFEQGLAP